MGFFEALIPIVALSVTFAGVSLFISYWFKTKKLQHDQIMAMIENDNLQGDIADFYGRKNRRRKFSFLPLGGLLLGIGTGMFVASLIDNLFGMRDAEPIYFGLIFMLGSAGYIVGNLIKIKWSSMHDD